MIISKPRMQTQSRGRCSRAVQDEILTVPVVTVQHLTARLHMMRQTYSREAEEHKAATGGTFSKFIRWQQLRLAQLISK